MAKKYLLNIPKAPNKHLHSRINFLNQAAAYLAELHSPIDPAEKHNVTQNDSTTAHCNGNGPDTAGMSRHILAQVYGISLKAQIRLAPSLKHSICCRCNSLLVPRNSSTKSVENLSKDGKKAWADVLVTRCDVCSAQKRFPVGIQRQSRRTARKSNPPHRTVPIVLEG